MRVLRPLFLLLVIVGGLNWLLVGLAQFDLVATVAGKAFGQTSLFSSAVYVLVGVAAIALVPVLIRWITQPTEAV
jgi:uncharacterized membrane protein YuzA (DUF378 family)